MRAVRSKSYFRKALAVLCSCALAASLVVPCLAYASTEDASGNTPVSDTQIMDGIVANKSLPAATVEDNGLIAQSESETAIEDATGEEGVVAQAQTCTVTFGDETVTVPKGSTLAGLIPDAPGGSYTIPDGIAAGQTVDTTFYGWALEEDSYGTRYNIPSLGKTNDGVVWAESGVNEFIKNGRLDMASDSTVVDGDLVFVKVFTAPLFEITITVSGFVKDMQGFRDDIPACCLFENYVVPKGFAVNENMATPLLNQFEKAAAEPDGLNSAFANINQSYCEILEGINATWNCSWSGNWIGGDGSGFETGTKVQFPLVADDSNHDIWGGYFSYQFGIRACVLLTLKEDSPASDLSALTVNGNTGIKAAGNLSGPNVPEGADIAIDTSVVTSGPAFDDLNDAMGDSRIGDIFEITLMVDGKEVHDGFGELSISIPIDPQYNNHVIIVYHRHQDGSITTSSHVARDGYVTFTVTDLSTFAYADGGLAPEEAAAEGSKPPKTADNDALLGGCAILFCVSLAGLVALRTTRRREEA